MKLNQKGTIKDLLTDNVSAELNNAVMGLLPAEAISIENYANQLLVREHAYGLFKYPIMSKSAHYTRNKYNVAIPNDYKTELFNIVNKEKVFKYGYDPRHKDSKYHEDGQLIDIGGISFIKKDDSVSYFHQLIGKSKNMNNLGNVKYVSLHGYHELIVDKDGNIVNDPLNMGTFNYGTGSNGWSDDYFGIYEIDHLIDDVIPYLYWGNSKDDPSNMPRRLMWFADSVRTSIIYSDEMDISQKTKTARIIW